MIQCEASFTMCSQAESAAALELDALIKVPEGTPSRSRNSAMDIAGARLEAGSKEDPGDRLLDLVCLNCVSLCSSCSGRCGSLAAQRQARSSCNRPRPVRRDSDSSCSIAFPGSCSCLGVT